MGTLRMSTRERQRLVCQSQVQAGTLQLAQAAGEMGVSYRRAKRLWRRFRKEGDAGLVHRLRGRPSNHQWQARERQRVLALYRQKYGDFGPTLAAEQLQKRDGITVAHETLQRWLLAAELWQPRRKRKGYRRWRARKEHLGEMVQMDGSEHAWFEGRGPWNRSVPTVRKPRTSASALTKSTEVTLLLLLRKGTFLSRDK